MSDTPLVEPEEVWLSPGAREVGGRVDLGRGRCWGTGARERCYVTGTCGKDYRYKVLARNSCTRYPGTVIRYQAYRC